MELFWILPPSIQNSCEGTSLPLETSRSQPRPRMTTVIPCLRMLKVHKVPGLLAWCQWSYMELPKVDGFPDFASWVTVGLEFGNSIRQDFDQWLVFAVHFQEGLVAASQPITVNCSVYDGSCDYQIIYEAHAVPHEHYTSNIKISIHALLYVCTTFSQLIVMWRKWS